MISRGAQKGSKSKARETALHLWKYGEGEKDQSLTTRKWLWIHYRGCLDYAWMVRLFGKLNNDSLCGPTGCAQRVPAKSKSKTKTLFTWAVLMGDAAVKTLLRQDKEITTSSSDSNYSWYIYIYTYVIIWHKISICTPSLWGVQGILLNCGTEGQQRTLVQGWLWILSLPVIKTGGTTSPILTNRRPWAKLKAFRNNFTLFLRVGMLHRL